MGYIMNEIPAKDARDNLSDILNRVVYQGARFLVTRHGKGEAVIISAEEWKKIEKQLQKLEDDEDIRDAQATMQDIESGKEKTISHDEMKRKLGL